MRNYEVGDMVLIGKVWGYIDKLSDNSQTLRARVMFENGWDIYPLSDIKTARKPRPGGKEARDIVAKILKRALNFRRKIDENTSYRLIYEVTIGDYEIAKAMLKEQV